MTGTYVTALGGAVAAAAGSVAAKRGAQELGRFLSLIASDSLSFALQAEGLADLLGSDAVSVLVALVDRLAGPGRTLDEAAARAAMLAVLTSQFGEVENFEDLERILAEALDADGILRMIERFLVEYVYQRMLIELGDRFRNGSPTAAAARQVERDLHDYIIARVQLDMAGIDPLRFDWNGEDGRTLIDDLTRDAYSQLALAT